MDENEAPFPPRLTRERAINNIGELPENLRAALADLSRELPEQTGEGPTISAPPEHLEENALEVSDESPAESQASCSSTEIEQEESPFSDDSLSDIDLTSYMRIGESPSSTPERPCGQNLQHNSKSNYK